MRSVTREIGDKSLNRYKKFLALRRKHISQPSIVEGLARIFDIVGTMQDKPTSVMYTRNYLRSSSELRGLDADAKKLTSDWYAVTGDLDKAIKKLSAKEGLPRL